MGACCTRSRNNAKEDFAPIKLENYNRWGIFAFNDQKYFCVYDFQESQAQFVIPQFNTPLVDYSFIYKTPLVFVLGGVDQSNKTVVPKVWISSPRDDTLIFSEICSMTTPRKKPWVLSPIEGSIFAIAGFYHPIYPHSILKTCERFYEGEDRWERTPSLNHPPKSIFTVGNSLYAFNALENLASFEYLNIKESDALWVVCHIKTEELQTELVEHFSLSCDNNNLLYIFGGIDQAGDASRATYTLDVNSGKLERGKELLSKRMIGIECSVDSKDYSYHLTKSLKLCIFSKSSAQWLFLDTNIQDKAAKRQLDIKL